MIVKDSLKELHQQNRILIQNDGFAYLAPHISLRPWISNYTITFPSNGMMSDEYSIIPHGCATLVFGRDEKRFHNTLYGPITKPVCVGFTANNYKILFIVEFQPAGYYAFSGMPQKELTDCVLQFDTINPAMSRLMSEQFEKAEDINGLIAGIDRLFAAHLRNSFYQREFSFANELILHSGGQIAVKELSEKVFYSERHLNRVFEEYMGIGVKPFSRLVRVNKAIRLLMVRGYSLTHVCMDAGFYDISHFIRDFKSICGVTPQEYRDNMSDFYSEIAKF